VQLPNPETGRQKEKQSFPEILKKVNGFEPFLFETEKYVSTYISFRA